jgi:hypothetical protein
MVRMHRYGPLFFEHASLGAIECAIKEGTAARDRIDRQVNKLKELHARRLQQVEAGEWPPQPIPEGDQSE